MMTSPAWPSSTDISAVRAIEAEAARVAHSSSGSTDLEARLAFAARLAEQTPTLRGGTAGTCFATLAAVAAADVALARTVEPHLDALGILEQAGTAPPKGTWGVFAAEAPGMRLRAEPTDGGLVLLTGTKPWCSLAGDLDHALITAEVADGARGLFAVDLHHPGITVHPEAWAARGLPDVPSGPVDFDKVPASPVGPPGWYMRRPGFAWGGIGVAACWWGGAAGLARSLQTATRERPDPWRTLALGETTVALADAEDAVAGAARLIDSGAELDEDAWSALAQLTRSRVRRAVDEVVRVTTSTLGPTPSATDAAYAARVSDLELYVLQDHGRKDLAALGAAIAAGEEHRR